VRLRGKKLQNATKIFYSLACSFALHEMKFGRMFVTEEIHGEFEFFM
jgi:hypothetical protein